MSPLRSLAAAVLAAAAVTSLPTVARDAGPYYRAELAAPANGTRIVAGGVLWMCEGTSCLAGKDNSRPLIVCKRLAKEAKSVARFTVAGEELAADDLARCNG